MGDPGLRCIGCSEEFGAPEADNRCQVSWPLLRLQNLTLSERYPGCLGETLAFNLRQAYLSGLVAADNFWREYPGGPEPRRVEGEPPAPEKQGLQPKSKARLPPECAEGEVSGVKEEVPNYSPDKSPESKEEDKKEDKEEAEEIPDKHPNAEREPLPRHTHTKKSRERRRSRSPQSSHRRREHPREDSRDPERGGREKKRRPRSDEPTPARSPLRQWETKPSQGEENYDDPVEEKETKFREIRAFPRSSSWDKR